MAHGLAGAHREELKDKQLLSFAQGTAQLPSKWIRNEQDRPKYVRYSMQHQEEHRRANRHLALGAVLA